MNIDTIGAIVFWMFMFGVFYTLNIFEKKMPLLYWQIQLAMFISFSTCFLLTWDKTKIEGNLAISLLDYAFNQGFAFLYFFFAMLVILSFTQVIKHIVVDANNEKSTKDG